MNIKESVEQYKKLEKEVYLSIFLESVRDTWNNNRLFSISPYGIDDHGEEGYEGLEDLTSNSLKLLYNINELLKVHDLPEYGFINDDCHVESERLENFLDKAFGYDDILPEDYEDLL